MKIFICLPLMLIPILALFSCSNDDAAELAQEDATHAEFQNLYAKFPILPTSDETTKLTGAMTWWFWEGDAGCFGTISDGRQNLNVYATADLCVTIEYAENERAVIEVVYDSEHQYSGNGLSVYTIVKFIEYSEVEYSQEDE